MRWIVLFRVCVLSNSLIKNILRAKCTAVIVGAMLKTANFAQAVANVKEMLMTTLTPSPWTTQMDYPKMDYP